MSTGRRVTTTWGVAWWWWVGARIMGLLGPRGSAVPPAQEAPPVRGATAVPPRSRDSWHAPLRTGPVQAYRTTTDWTGRFGLSPNPKPLYRPSMDSSSTSLHSRHHSNSRAKENQTFWVLTAVPRPLPNTSSSASAAESASAATARRPGACHRVWRATASVCAQRRAHWSMARACAWLRASSTTAPMTTRGIRVQTTPAPCHAPIAARASCAWD